ncbi:MAG: hypothetical protein QM791_17815 [Ferruginibacter sp.]
MKLIKYCLLALLLNINFKADAQLISGVMQFINPVQEKDSNTLSFAYSNLFYIKDYEYFNSIQTGYTYFGTWQKPELVYQPNKWLRLHAGLLAQRDFGDHKFSKVRPVYSAQIQQKNFRFIFGTLEGNQSHDLIEPLLSYDKIIERPVEEGVQFKYNSHRFNADFWLDWEILQTENSDFPEEFNGGAAFSYTLTKPTSAWQVKIPVQFILPHKGGQLDTNSSAVSTVINTAQGLWVEWNNPDKESWLKQFRTDGYHAGYFHSESASPYPFNKGNGALVNLFLKSKWDISFLASYWGGSKFIAPRGAKIYESVSSISTLPDYYETSRQLLFLNMIYEKQLAPGLYIDARFSPYFDLKNKLREYSFQILLSYRDVFRLFTFKKKQ